MGCAPRPSPFPRLSLQNEGTRLQKDLRTYLASVKGKGQTWPGWAGLHGTQGRAFPGRGLPRGSQWVKSWEGQQGLWGTGKGCCGGPYTSWASGNPLS